MNSFSIAIHVGLIVGAVLAVLCLLSIFEQQWSQLLGTFFALLLRPFISINDSLQSFWRGVEEFYRGQFSSEGQLDLQQVFYQFIGAVLYTLFFLAFNYSEFYLLALSLAATGIDTGHFKVPIGAGVLTALALIASFLFWGAVILDLSGVTNIAPWREALNDKWKRCLFYAALFSLVLSLFVSGSMGFFRGKVIADESFAPVTHDIQLSDGISDSSTAFSQGGLKLPGQIEPLNSDGVYYWIPIIANVCIPILVGIGGLVAGWGVVTLIKFMILLVGFLVIAPLGLLLLFSSLFVIILDRSYQLMDAILQLCAAMGNRFMGIFGWSPKDSGQTQSQDNSTDTPSGNDEAEFDDHSDNQCSSVGQQEDGQAISNDDGWDPFRKQGGL